MKTLLILRHAKSSWDDSSISDHERPLNDRGRKSAPLIGELIKKEEILPDYIVSSTARRAKETADLIVQYSGYTGDIHLAKELYDSSPEHYIKVLRSLSKEYKTVLIVGHNPILEMLAELLTKEKRNFPTAALMQLKLSIEHWYEFSAKTETKIINFWTPKEIEH